MTDNIRMFPQSGNLAQKTKEPEVCPKCKTPLSDQDFGWVREDRAHVHTEKCLQRTGFCLIPCPVCSGGVQAKRKIKAVNSLFDQSNIPWDMKEWNFSNYPFDADQEAGKEVKLQIKHWIEGKQAKRALYLVGDRGRCKTSLAISVLHYWLQQERDGLFISTAEMFAILREGISASRTGEEGQKLYRMTRSAQLATLVKSVELLVMDDLGVGCGSEYEVRELYLILETRKHNGLYTIFTSNCKREALEKHWRDKQGAFDSGLRIIDRIGQYAFPIEVQGRNQRERE